MGPGDPSYTQSQFLRLKLAQTQFLAFTFVLHVKTMQNLNQINVANLNYEYLAQFRELFQRSQAEACLRYNMSVEAGRQLARCTHQELKAVASRARMVVSLRLEDLPSAPH